jgi:hypothetical protein
MPPPLDRERGAYFRATSRALAEWPLVEALVRLVVTRETIEFARVAVGGVAPVPLRLEGVEEALTGRPASWTCWQALCARRSTARWRSSRRSSVDLDRRVSSWSTSISPVPSPRPPSTFRSTSPSAKASPPSKRRRSSGRYGHAAARARPAPRGVGLGTRLLLRAQRTITERATSPASIAANASLTSSSLISREISSSSFSSLRL